jgi:hypothetical protein
MTPLSHVSSVNDTAKRNALAPLSHAARLNKQFIFTDLAVSTMSHDSAASVTPVSHYLVVFLLTERQYGGEFAVVCEIIFFFGGGGSARQIYGSILLQRV